MRILLDASVLQYPATGIAKATLYLYKACYNLLQSLDVTAFHRLPLQCELPANIYSQNSWDKIPNTLWRNLAIPVMGLKGHYSAFHFPWNGDVPPLMSGNKTVSTIHDVLPLIIPGYFDSPASEQLYRKRVQKDIDRSSLVITDSFFSKNEILKNFEVRREPKVIYLGPTINKPRDKYLEPSKGSYFLYVGGYDPRKGIDKLLKAFLQLHRQKSLSSKLILTGSQNYFSQDFKNLVNEAKELGVIEELGYVSDEKLTELYCGARALVYPSKYEGFGLPPLEAMTVGCPVIATRNTSVPEICGEAALYVNPDDELSFAAALIAVETDDNLGKELREKGRKQAEKFSWESSASGFLQEIQGLMRK